MRKWVRLHRTLPVWTHLPIRLMSERRTPQIFLFSPTPNNAMLPKMPAPVVGCDDSGTSSLVRSTRSRLS